MGNQHIKQSSVFTEHSLFLTGLSLLMAVFAVFISMYSVFEPTVLKDVTYLSIGKGMCVYLLGMLLLVGACRLLGETCRRWVLFLLWALSVTLQLVIVFQMQLIPSVDLSHIIDQIDECLNANDPVFTDQTYFGFYTNNIPITIVLYWVFRIARAAFGAGADLQIVGGLFNVMMIFLAMLGAYLLLRRTTTPFVTFWVMVLLLTNPTFYAYTSYYYTDTFSMPFAMNGLLCLVAAGDELRKGPRMGLFLGAGAILGVGYYLRATCIFVLIAWLVYSLFMKKWRLCLEGALPVLAGVLLIMAIYQPVLHYHVPYDTKETAVPISHFLMMGSHGTGVYDNDDVVYTWSFSDAESRASGTMTAWKSNVKENGISGNLRLAYEKEIFVWGVGSHWYQQYTEKVETKTRVYEWIRGKCSDLFQGVMQFYNILFYALLAAGLLSGLKKGTALHLIIVVYFFGAVFFYLFWEAHPRHSFNFMPVLTLLTIPLFERLEEKPKT